MDLENSLYDFEALRVREIVRVEKRNERRRRETGTKITVMRGIVFLVCEEDEEDWPTFRNWPRGKEVPTNALEASLRPFAKRGLRVDVGFIRRIEI